MKKRRMKDSYTEAFIDYQGKQNLPGYYIGGKLHPVLKAKTKTGGYYLLVGGIFMLCFSVIQLLFNFNIENLGWIIEIVIAVLLIMVGIKFIKLNSR